MIGLDGVVQQQANYAKSGFRLAHRNIRFGGKPDRQAFASVQTSNSEIRQMQGGFQQAIERYDGRKCFPCARRQFLRAWLAEKEHQVSVAFDGGNVVGYAVLRPCALGFKVGPLFADDHAIAKQLLADLLTGIGENEPIFVDVPEPNASAVALATSLGLEPAFETARMYTGEAPANVDLSCVFGVTTFELG